MYQKIPAYIYEKGNTVKMIYFTAAFALLFINIFQPFGSRDWYPYISDIKYFFFSSLIILLGMLVVVISRIIMLAYAKKRDINYWTYVMWIAAEIFAMSLFYALFAKFIPKEGVGRDFMVIFKQSAVNTALILLLSYAILWLYFSWKEKNRLLESLEQEKPIENFGKLLIAFPDEKGELKISVLMESLLYIDSADNYVTIHYNNKSKISHFMIRNSLKWIDENLSKNTPLVRCHRSYMVNLDNVKVLKKTKEGIMLELDSDNAPDIPVSKTYYDRFMQKFSRYSV